MAEQKRDYIKKVAKKLAEKGYTLFRVYRGKSIKVKT